MKNILLWIDKNIETAIASVFLVAMLALGAVQITCRYLPISPFVWTEELILYLFVWVVFLTVSYAIRSDDHIRITFLKAILPPKAQIGLDILSYICFILFAVLCMPEAMRIVELLKEQGQMAVTIPNFPVWILYFSMPVCFVNVIIRSIQAIVLKVIVLKKDEVS